MEREKKDSGFAIIIIPSLSLSLSLSISVSLSFSLSLSLSLSSSYYMIIPPRSDQLPLDAVIVPIRVIISISRPYIYGRFKSHQITVCFEYED